MSTEAAETVTAQTTEVTEAPVMPGRDEILKFFAREASGEPPEPEAPANAGGNDAAVALSQPEAESETQVAETPEGETETPEDQPDELDGLITPEIQEKINRRIGKEVAKTKVEREQREAVEAQLAELTAQMAERPAAPKATGPMPLAEIHEPGKLAVKKHEAEEALEQAEQFLNDLEDDPDGVAEALKAAKIELPEYSEAHMKKFLRTVKTNADRMLRKSIPEREKFLVTAERFANETVEWMPELKDPKSARAKLFQQTVRENPWIQQRPEWPALAMLGVLGKERFDELKAAKNKAAPKPKREVPVTIPAPRTQPPTTPRLAPKGDDAKTMADKLLNGERSVRMQYIQSLVKG